jgi:hypothetical protein
MFTWKKCRWVSWIVCLVFAACSEITVYEAQAGALAPPESLNFNVVHQNHWGSGGAPNTADGHGLVAGPILLNEFVSAMFVVGSVIEGDPVDINVSFQFEGRRVSPAEPLTDEMLFLAENPIYSSANYTVSRVNFTDGGFVIFDPVIRLGLSTQSQFYYDDTGRRVGFTNTHLTVSGGVVTNSFGELNENHWDGPGPRPEWLPEFYGVETWSIRATNPSTVHYVPEPANAAVMSLLGLASLGFRRR